MNRRSFLSTVAGTLSTAFTLSDGQFHAFSDSGGKLLSRSQSSASGVSPESHRFETTNFVFGPFAEGVYCAVAKLGAPGGSNSAIIVDEDWVLVTDTQFRPSAAREVIRGIARITPLPVRFVVNTHFHNDHTQGNQAYFGVFPKGVEYLSHQNTRRDIREKAMPRVRKEIALCPRISENRASNGSDP